MTKQKQKQKGFTLIELLVVIAIIGILAALILSNLSTVREKARDSQRKSDLRALADALSMYSDDNNYMYPSSSGSWVEVNTSTLASLSPTYLKMMPEDPINSAVYKYYYKASNDRLNYGVAARLETFEESVSINEEVQYAQVQGLDIEMQGLQSSSTLHSLYIVSDGGSGEVYIYDNETVDDLVIAPWELSYERNIYAGSQTPPEGYTLPSESQSAGTEATATAESPADTPTATVESPADTPTATAESSTDTPTATATIDPYYDMQNYFCDNGDAGDTVLTNNTAVNWEECWEWCKQNMDSTNACCQKNGGTGNCWLKTGPYGQPVGDCTWSLGNAYGPWGGYYSESGPLFDSEGNPL